MSVKGSVAYLAAGIVGGLVGGLVVWLTTPGEVAAMALGSGGVLAGLVVGIPLALHVDKKEWERGRW